MGKGNNNFSMIENAANWYAFYIITPVIAFIFAIAIFFVWGIIDALYCIVLNLDEFLVWLVWQIIGIVIGGISYVVVKISTAITILKVEYLREINYNIKKIAKSIRGEKLHKWHRAVDRSLGWEEN